MRQPTCLGRAATVLVLMAFLNTIVVPTGVFAQSPECTYDREKPSIENARYNFKVTNYECAEQELQDLLALDTLNTRTKADAHVLLAAVYYAKVRDDEEKQDRVVEQFIAAFQAYREWRGDLDIKSPEFVAMMEQAQAIVDQTKKPEEIAEDAQQEAEETVAAQKEEAAAQVPQAAMLDTGKEKKPWYKRWYVLGLGAVLVGGAVAIAAGGGGGDDELSDLPDFPPNPGGK